MRQAKNLFVSFREHSFYLERFKEVGLQSIHMDAWNAELTKPVDIISLEAGENMQTSAFAWQFYFTCFSPFKLTFSTVQAQLKQKQ